jgi:hypothetical protein
MAKKDAERANLMNRVMELYRGKPPSEMFTAVGFANQMDTDDLRDLLNMVSDTGPIDYNAKYAGKPVSHWLGKSVEQIHRELGDSDKTSAVVEGLRSMNLQVPGVTPVMTTADIAEDRQRTTYLGPRRPLGPQEGEELPETQDGGELEVAEYAEPRFGNDQIPFSKLRGQPDDELRKNPGIGTNAIVEIRRLEMESAQREAEQSRTDQGREEMQEAIQRANENESDFTAAGSGVVGGPGAGVATDYAEPETARQGTRGGGGGRKGGRGGNAPQNQPERGGTQNGGSSESPAGSGATGG